MAIIERVSRFKGGLTWPPLLKPFPLDRSTSSPAMDACGVETTLATIKSPERSRGPISINSSSAVNGMQSSSCSWTIHDVDANQLLAESLDALRKLGDSCDHSIGICWCRHWKLCVRIAEYLDSQCFPHGESRKGERG